MLEVIGRGDQIARLLMRPAQSGEDPRLVIWIGNLREQRARLRQRDHRFRRPTLASEHVAEVAQR